MTGADIIAEARSWIGTPFVHQAALKGVGCDCIGLVVGVAAALGMPEAAAWKADQEFSGYGPTPEPKKLLKACEKYLDRIPPGQAALGDILLFNFVAQGVRDPMHFGLITQTDPRYLIHAYQFNRKVAEHCIDVKWSRRICAAWRYRGLK